MCTTTVCGHYIHGWKNSPSLTERARLRGRGILRRTSRNNSEAKRGAQSSIVPCRLDAGLGIAHAPDPLTLYLQEMRDYMPPRHRSFLQVLEKATDDLGRPLLAGYVRDRKFRNPELWTAYGACVDLLVTVLARSTSATPTVTSTANISPMPATLRPWEQAAHPSCSTSKSTWMKRSRRSFSRPFRPTRFISGYWTIG